MSSSGTGKILVAGESDSSRATIVDWLRQSGYEVLQAGTGGQLLARAAEWEPEAIVLHEELLLPDGTHACDRLKHQPGTRHIPLIQLAKSGVPGSLPCRCAPDLRLSTACAREHLSDCVALLLRARRAEIQSQARGDYLRAVLGGITEAYFALDAQWRVVEVNPIAETVIFGRTREQLLGRSYWELFPESHGSDFEREYTRAWADGTPAHFEAFSPTVHRWFEVHAYPHEERLDIYSRNITERKEAEERLRASEQRLRQEMLAIQRTKEELNATKEDLAATNAVLEQKVEERTTSLREALFELESFSYALVHDLRAPLRAMNSFSGMVLELCANKVVPEAEDYLRRIGASASRLDRLIVDALTYGRIVRRDWQLCPLDLEALVQGILDSYPNLHESRAQFHLARPLLPVIGNPALLTQAIANLLDNAVKFVVPGVVPQITIRTEGQNEHVKIWVEDNGIGIAEEHSHHLFEMFQRIHSREDYPGTGIGLAIVRKAADRMGGKVGFCSAVGQGSRFWLQLPRADTQGAGVTSR